MAAQPLTVSRGTDIRADLANHSRYCVSQQRIRPHCPICHGEPGDDGSLDRVEIISMGGPVTLNPKTNQLETVGAIVAVIPKAKYPITYRPNAKNSSELAGVTAHVNAGAVNVPVTTGVSASPGLGFRNASSSELAVDESKLTDSQRAWRARQKG